MTISKIKKRDGRIVDFTDEKIYNAVLKAFKAVYSDEDKSTDTKKVTELTVKYADEKFDDKITPSVEEIQDLVERSLIELDYTDVAKKYIVYRHNKSIQREMKEVMGIYDDLKLPINSLRVLERRYLLRDDKGKIIETPSQLFRRVSKFIASADKAYGTDEKTIKYYENAFYNIMTNFEFLPNSPTLMNAGTDLGQLSACFVLKVGDSLRDIFETVKQTAIIHKTGGGTGFSFSRLRPKGDIVKSTAGVASGPVSFMRVFDVATDVVKQGGKRRGANMGILDIWHPDIEEFITAKQTPGVLENFNMSIAVTDEFMNAVIEDKEFAIRNPRTKEPVRMVKAKQLFSLITYSAWKSAEPGLFFIDTANKANQTPKYPIFSTNPCGEVPMPDYESCNLGSINLAKFVDLDWSNRPWKEKVRWDRLSYVVKMAIHFLDNVIDLNKFPLEQIDKQTKLSRRIGLGVMGFARMLSMMGIGYNTKKGREIAEYIMKFISDEGRKMSHELGRVRGSFPGFKESIWVDKYDALRNATITSMAPTGTISMISSTTSGIEPLFALAFVKNVMDGTQFFYVEPVFEQVLKVRGLYSPELMQKVVDEGTIQNIDEIPDDIKKVFAISYDISPEDHVKIQAAFQKYTDLAVSKTINMPNSATVEDVEKAYILAWKLKCKGVTIYRDGSRGAQVLNIGKKK